MITRCALEAPDVALHFQTPHEAGYNSDGLQTEITVPTDQLEETVVSDREIASKIWISTH